MTDVVVGVIVSYLARDPGAKNPEIRAELARCGHRSFTKSTLNSLLYTLHPDPIYWRELADGTRGWWPAQGADAGSGNTDSDVLILSTERGWGT